MNTIALLIAALAFGTPYAPDQTNLIIPYQSRGNVELYSQRDSINLWVDLSLSHSYEFRDEIFILPTEYQGTSELYTLGFYIDQDTEILDVYDANAYRILYWFPQHEFPVAPIPATPIPGPTSLLVFLAAAPLLLTRGIRSRKSVR